MLIGFLKNTPTAGIEPASPEGRGYLLFIKNCNVSQPEAGLNRHGERQNLYSPKRGGPQPEGKSLY
ncbi:hypothetical protein A3K82_01630 [Candidatus Pacearchaeota archaeon RBG_19FT_COMBO_34_9]|nr:MAG: hypothetical protein A3K82_01630 [Candidatus Pacearchaeota archaeon RBG_19FT_COMBO_34_9]OGJ16761.1 MAG: hypothetical protein A3K74_00920 [Candidatus Pacearchaeota archaeon RBG_13_33_26]